MYTYIKTERRSLISTRRRQRRRGTAGRARAVDRDAHLRWLPPRPLQQIYLRKSLLLHDQSQDRGSRDKSDVLMT